MEVNTQEREDGSIDVDLKMSTEEMRLLIQYAVRTIILESIEKNNIKKPEPPSDRLIKEGEQPGDS